LLSRTYPDVSFVRYADDIIIHCKSKAQAEGVLEAIKGRLLEVRLEIKQEKTRIAYCKDYRRKERHENVKFDFLGFSFQPRARKSKFDDTTFTAFTAEISQSNQKKIRESIKDGMQWNNTSIDILYIANIFNSKLRGWIGYYGIYSKSRLRLSLQVLDRRLIKWLRKKYRLGYKKACIKLKEVMKQNPKLFYHWETGYG
jgi:RNA-directed DNA polymerase